MSNTGFLSESRFSFSLKDVGHVIMVKPIYGEQDCEILRVHLLYLSIGNEVMYTCLESNDSNGYFFTLLPEWPKKLVADDEIGSIPKNVAIRILCNQISGNCCYFVFLAGEKQLCVCRVELGMESDLRLFTIDRLNHPRELVRLDICENNLELTLDVNCQFDAYRLEMDFMNMNCKRRKIPLSLRNSCIGFSVNDDNDKMVRFMCPIDAKTELTITEGGVRIRNGMEYQMPAMQKLHNVTLDGPPHINRMVITHSDDQRRIFYNEIFVCSSEPAKTKSETLPHHFQTHFCCKKVLVVSPHNLDAVHVFFIMSGMQRLSFSIHKSELMTKSAFFRILMLSSDFTSRHRDQAGRHKRLYLNKSQFCLFHRLVCGCDERSLEMWSFRTVIAVLSFLDYHAFECELEALKQHLIKNVGRLSVTEIESVLDFQFLASDEIDLFEKILKMRNEQLPSAQSHFFSAQ